ncbi:hypothetical protein TNCV_2284451 [Trichonephila clavipes]|nr:hypothetical protein TNCV_2284451 [Trichonephila clavipes]
MANAHLCNLGHWGAALHTLPFHLLTTFVGLGSVSGSQKLWDECCLLHPIDLDSIRPPSEKHPYASSTVSLCVGPATL